MLELETLLVVEGIVKVVVRSVGDRFCKKMDVVTVVQNKYVVTISISTQTRPNTPSYSYTSNKMTVCVVIGAYFCRTAMLTEVTEGSGFGDLEVACWPLVPKFAGSNPAEAVRFFRAKKSSVHLPSEGK